MEQPTIVLTMTRKEFEKLATGWFISQIQNGVCTCEACEGVAEILGEGIEELYRSVTPPKRKETTHYDTR